MRRKLKRIGATLLAAAMVFTALPVKQADAATKINNETLTIYCWSESTQNQAMRFVDHYPKYKNLIKIVNLNVGGASPEYKKAIRKASGVVYMDECFVDTYKKSNKFASVSSIGIKSKDYKNAYSYTKKKGTYKKQLKALSFQACPGYFVYNCRIAREVLGTDDPAKVQAYVKNWDEFQKTAQLMDSKGYNMLYSSSELDPVLGSNKKALAKQSKALNNYYKNNEGFKWDDKWTEGFANSSNTTIFGYFGASWFSDVITSFTGKKKGVFNVCEGPQAFSWGGTYMMVTKDCKNPGLAALFMKDQCCNATSMQKAYKATGDFPNNQVAVKKTISYANKHQNKVFKAKNYATILSRTAKKIK